MPIHILPFLAIDPNPTTLLVVYITLAVVGGLVTLWCTCLISGKLGHSPWMGLLLFIPGAWMIFCAFAEAPNEIAAKRAKRLAKKARQSQGSSPRTSTSAGGSGGGSAWASTPDDRAAEALDDFFE
jgi:hypothetical protein